MGSGDREMRATHWRDSLGCAGSRGSPILRRIPRADYVTLGTFVSMSMHSLLSLSGHDSCCQCVEKPLAPRPVTSILRAPRPSSVRFRSRRATAATAPSKIRTSTVPFPGHVQSCSRVRAQVAEGGQGEEGESVKPKRGRPRKSSTGGGSVAEERAQGGMVEDQLAVEGSTAAGEVQQEDNEGEGVEEEEEEASNSANIAAIGREGLGELRNREAYMARRGMSAKDEEPLIPEGKTIGVRGVSPYSGMADGPLTDPTPWQPPPPHRHLKPYHWETSIGKDEAGAGYSGGVVVCLGEAVVEFVPQVRESTRQASEEVFASWRSLQWVAPEFARAPGATSCHVALALGRMSVPAAFIGMLGDDLAGQNLMRSLQENGVMTGGVLVSPSFRTAISEFQLPEGPLVSPVIPPWALPPSAPSAPATGHPPSLGLPEWSTTLASLPSVLQILSQSSWLHCTALSFTLDPVTAAAVESCISKALTLSAERMQNLSTQTTGVEPGNEGSESLVLSTGAAPPSAPLSPSPSLPPTRLFLDANLPLPLWQSREHAWAVLSRVWNRASVVEVSKIEAEFLMGEETYIRRREARVRYAAESYYELRSMHDTYHYSPAEVAPLWAKSDGALELILITDGTVLVHYYTREFHGSVDGTEDVLVAALTCDRSGSGDAMVAGMLLKLVEDPGVLRDQDKLERAIRFSISAGVISQWTTGAVRSFPTAEATQNLTEQMFLTSLV